MSEATAKTVIKALFLQVRYVDDEGMTEFSTAYQVACVPGPNAAVAMTRLPNGAPVLVVYLDPVNMTIQAPPTRTGVRGLADFCRELAHEASRLAAVVDPDGEPASPETSGPRHALMREDFGEREYARASE